MPKSQVCPDCAGGGYEGVLSLAGRKALVCEACGGTGRVTKDDTQEAYNPRYLAYARYHDKTPEEMLKADRRRWPGGSMTGYILWIDQKWNEFCEVEPKRKRSDPSMGTLEVQAQFDYWLFEQHPGWMSPGTWQLELEGLIERLPEEALREIVSEVALLLWPEDRKAPEIDTSVINGILDVLDMHGIPEKLYTARRERVDRED